MSPITNSWFQPVKVSFNIKSRILYIFHSNLANVLAASGNDFHTFQVFFLSWPETWIQYHNQLLHREMEVLDKFHLSITVHMYVLIDINDVYLRLFQLKVLQIWRKVNDTSKPQPRPYKINTRFTLSSCFCYMCNHATVFLFVIIRWKFMISIMQLDPTSKSFVVNIVSIMKLDSTSKIWL